MAGTYHESLETKMSDERPQLQLEIDSRFQKTEWSAQRVGWAIWIGLIIAGCLGLLGPGMLSDRRIPARDGAFTLKYERFLHHHNPSQLEVNFERSANADGQWTIRLGQPLLDGIQIMRIEPEPVHQQIGEDGASYTFAAAAGAPSGRVVFHVEYEHYGELSGWIAADDSEPIHFSQFVYP